MRWRMLFVLFAVLIALTSVCVAAGPAQAQSWDWLAPDALTIVKPLRDLADVGDALSWVVAAPAEYRVWLDVFRPFGDAGAGLSVDVQAGQPLCAGAGWIDDRWTGYLGGHIDVTW